MKKTNVKTIIKWVVFALGIIGTAVAFYFDSALFGENSIFNQSVSDNNFINAVYQKIPAVIKSLQIIILSIALDLIVHLVFSAIFRGSNRSITIGKLFESFIKWVIVIAAILFILSAWGVDATALLASAGILTLVIGLGAQSLVADIVAGVFMVFEGEFQVGDIVIINDWRGTVKEIGIRTTKIVDAGGNINIVNNSEITTVINQTQDVSLAKCIIGVEYGESLARVEQVIKDNIDGIKNNLPAIIEGPYYKGVNALNASSVDLLFVAKCKEEDLYQVQRDLNRELKMMFDENQINIPFPQIVLNQPTAKTTKTKVDKKSVKDFVDKQRELSKNLEDERDNA